MYGDLLTWKCEEGYLWQSLEPPTIYCESDSVWRPQLNYSEQICFPIGCNRFPEIPENSQIIEESKVIILPLFRKAFGTFITAAHRTISANIFTSFGFIILSFRLGIYFFNDRFLNRFLINIFY